MNLQKISLEAIQDRTVAILGYGNQGRAQALNLRDSGLKVLVGARPGKGFDLAKKDGFDPLFLREAAEGAEIVMLLLPDHVIPDVTRELTAVFLSKPKMIGFSHGFALHFGYVEIVPGCSYFLVTPKGAGAILRDHFIKGVGLPGAFAIHAGAIPEMREVCLSYAKGIGVAQVFLLETTFQEETECDLFGEQAVLCGGVLQLMENAYNILVKNGHSPEMSFLECCYEARLILELWMKFGPHGLSNQISPTAFFGGLTRGRRVITESTEKEMEKIFSEIRSGEFAREWMAEVKNGMPESHEERARLKEASLQNIYHKLKTSLLPESS